MSVILDTGIETFIIENEWGQAYILVNSHGFRGHNRFCFVQDGVCEAFVAGLNALNRLELGSCKLTDYDSDSFIIVESVEKGKLIISGQLGGTHRDHYFHFKFNSDQTILNSLI